MQYNEKVKP